MRLVMFVGNLVFFFSISFPDLLLSLEWNYPEECFLSFLLPVRIGRGFYCCSGFFLMSPGPTFSVVLFDCPELRFSISPLAHGLDIR